MEIQHYRDKKAYTISFPAELTKKNARDAEFDIQPILANIEATTIILDFNETQFIDSSGIGLVILIYKRLKERDGDVYACCLNTENAELFEMTRLIDIIRVFPSEQAALETL